MTGILTVCIRELRRIFALAPVFATIILGSLIYAVFYPQPYVNEALRNVPIAVVDRDHTPASREFIRAVDASADVAVVEQYADMPTAERAVFARSLSGILYIPQHFERDLLHGRQAPVAVYGDASYFLIYQRIAGAVSSVAATMGAKVESARLVAGGVDPVIAAAAVDPMPLTAVPLFNPQGGYATYVLPAALVLILQQILLIGVGLLGTLPDAARSVPSTTPQPGPAVTVIGKLCAYLAIQAVLLPFYLIALPYLYGLPRLGGVAEIMLFAVPFVLAVGSLGMVLAAIFKTPLAVQLSMAALGLPFFFLAGFAWPTEAIPPAIRTLSLLVPSTSAIDGFVDITQLGAHIGELQGTFLILCTLAAVYGTMAVLLEKRRRRVA